MSDEPIKFRCYRCGKLLGAPSRRVGAVVACPQCRTEIQVPAPTADDPQPPELAFLGSEEVAVEPDFSAILAPAGDAPIPPIRIEASVPDATATPAPRAPDVILPPGVVMAWSLLVLTAIPLAFVAGLLLGHFVWK